MRNRSRFGVSVASSVACLTLAALTIAPGEAARGGPDVCFGQRPTIRGTDASEVLIGTEGADVIVGGGGMDVIRGRGGDDRICDNALGSGGSTDRYNRLRGGAGNDRLSGGPDLQGGPGDDLLRSRGTRTTISLWGGSGDDVLRGRESVTTWFMPGGGDDSVFGSPNGGSRLIYRGHADIVVDLRSGVVRGEGTDVVSRIHTVRTGRGDDLLRGTSSWEDLDAGRGDDRLLGGSAWDYLHGGRGDDTLVGGPGSSDTLNGSRGQDRCIDDAPAEFISCERILRP